MSSFNNRVFGCVVIKAINSNYNADFTHQPRTLPDGTVYATDKVLKYSIRNFLKKAYSEENIFFFKSVNEDLKPLTLDESYKKYFGEFPKKENKKSKDTTAESYYLFKFDGENLVGFLPSKPKPAAIKKYFKELPEDSELHTLKRAFDEIVGKDATQNTLETTKKSFNIEDEEECFFFFIKDKIKKIDGVFNEIEKVAIELDNMVTGGLDRKIILANLLSCIDIRLFGGTYAGQANISIHGPVQITHAIDQYKKGEIYSEQIMSPFRNPGDKNADSTMTTLGSQSKLSEGHYVHGFSVNPQNIADHVALSDGTALQNEDIQKLKVGLTRGVSFYDSAAKSGSENELMLWVQLKEGSLIVLPSFVELVKITVDKSIDLTGIAEILNRPHIASQLEKIEIVYHQTATKVLGIPQNAIVSDLNQ